MTTEQHREWLREVSAACMKAGRSIEIAALSGAASGGHSYPDDLRRLRALLARS